MSERETGGAAATTVAGRSESVMAVSATLTTGEIERFVAEWFHALDIHVPLESAELFLADDGLHMHFPDGEITDFASFKTWYDRVTHLFFDEVHNVASVDAQVDGDTATVDIVVAWQASWFEPPAPRSKRTAMDATQRWTVRRSTKNTFGLEIVTYDATVEPFNYAPGFARL